MALETETPDDDIDDMTLTQRIISEVKFLLGLFAFITVFFTLVWGHYKIPSESMQPTLEVGDHLYVSKFAYGYSRYSLPFGLDRLPFLKSGKIFSRAPKRGDVLVFKHPTSGLVMIKRVIGLPGDSVQTVGGRLYINNRAVKRTEIANFLYRQHKGGVVGVDVYEELWDETETPHVIYEQTDQNDLDNVGPFDVPADHVFMMGDNRDNSIDSRAPSGPGMVPFDHLIGRADLMMFSFKKCKKEEGMYCPPKRFLKPL